MGGTIEKVILKKTVNIPFINDYFSGKLKRDNFRSLVNDNKDILLDAGLSGYWIQLLMEMPADNKSDALRMLNTLFNTSRIKSADFDDETYNKFFDNIERKFQHLPNRYTSIFTE